MKPGKITQRSDGYMVEFERSLQHPIEKVWDALTNPSVLKVWFTEVEMDFREGGKMVIHFADGSSSNGEIVTIQPPTLFEFTWEGELAQWKLSASSKTSCVLKLTYSKLAKDYAIKAPAGFHIILDQLESVLNGRTQPFLLGATTEDPLQKKMVEMYSELYPEI